MDPDQTSHLPSLPLILPVLEYLYSIEGKFNESVEVQEHFLLIIDDFREQKVDVIGVVERFSVISKDEPRLIYGLTPFLPPNYKISCNSYGEFHVIPSTEVINYGEICNSSSVRYLHGRVQRHGDFPVEGGAFADIWVGTFEKKKVAIKILRRFNVNASKYATRLWRECRTWGQLSHPNILPFLGVCLEHISETSLVPCFVSPWMDNGTVINYIRRYPNANRLPLLLGISEGLHYLHTRVPAVVHGDIRAGNILVSMSGTPFLSDFGLSRMLLEAGGTTSSSTAGSSRWMAPELFEAGRQPVTTHSDVWAFGMTIIEILTGNHPYQEVTNHTFVYQHIVKRKLPIRPANVNGLDDNMWRLFLNCCAHKPPKRHTISAVTERLSQLSSPSPAQSANGLGRAFSVTRSRTRASLSISTGQPNTDRVLSTFRSYSFPNSPPPAEAWPPIEEAQLDEEAKRISDTIDEQLKQEAALRMKPKGRRSKEIRVILLGQSESGKSTVLKQFQLACTTDPFHEERHAWRLVIYFNIIRSVLRIFVYLQDFWEKKNSMSPHLTDDRDVGAFLDSMHHRLSPLRGLEELLLLRLGGKAHREATRLDSSDSMMMSTPSQGNDVDGLGNRMVHQTLGYKAQSPGERRDNIIDPARVMNDCGELIAELWGDERVQAKLRQIKRRLEEEAGFFLDCLPRVTALDYMPSDTDILKARLKTVGVNEQSFESESDHDGKQTWRFYDTHGAKGNRYVWLGHFDELDAMIFVASISAFDHVSPDDSKLNSIEDSVEFWRNIVGHKLLGDIPIILFLNKCDLLRAKLEAGVRFTHHVTSFGDRQNNCETVTQYIRTRMFIHQGHSCNPKRKVYVHLTSMTDMSTMGSIIGNVQRAIVRNHLAGLRIL